MVVYSSVVCETMYRQDYHRQYIGLVKVRDGPHAYMSPGVRKHPKELILPLPQSESVNTTKIINTPEKIDNLVEAKSDILKESTPDIPQKEYLTGKRKAIKSSEIAHQERLQPQELHRQIVKRKKKEPGNSEQRARGKYAI